MQDSFQKPPFAPRVQYGFQALCTQDIPWPALERGWLHGRLCAGPWDLARLLERIGDGLWLSYYSFDGGVADTADLRKESSSRSQAARHRRLLAGRWLYRSLPLPLQRRDRPAAL